MKYLPYNLCLMYTCEFHYNCSSPLNHASQQGGIEVFSLWAVFMEVCVKVFSDTKRGALNFKWDCGGQLKRRRRKSVEGFTHSIPPLPPAPPPFLSSSSLLSPLSLTLSLVNLFKKHLYSHTRLQGHVVMLLCYLNVKQNVRVMAERECTIKMKLLTGEGKKYSNIQNKQKYLYSCL